jgi:hypothetical protein
MPVFISWLNSIVSSPNLFNLVILAVIFEITPALFSFIIPWLISYVT